MGEPLNTKTARFSFTALPIEINSLSQLLNNDNFKSKQTFPTQANNTALDLGADLC